MNKVLNQNSIVLDSSCNDYDVSVCVITYNKEKYIREAIDSVLKQKTTCKYEIVIGDNASTDNTTSILKEYWQNDHDRFSIIFNKTNLGLTTNIYNTMQKAKGKYIIILYGDDYWIDKNKMQTQFDYLENNVKCNAVTTAICSIYDGEKESFRVFPNKKLMNKYCTLQDYLNGYDFPMAGVMFKNEIFSKNESHFKKMLEASLFIDDLSFCILLLMLGDVFVIGMIMGAYRCFKKDSNSTNFNSVNPKIKRDKMSVELLNNLDSVTGNQLDLRMRYSLIMASSFSAVVKKEMKLIDYKNLLTKLPKKYSSNHFHMLIEGILRKICLQ